MLLFMQLVIYSWFLSVLILLVDDIMEAFNRWRFRETLPADAHKKVRKVLYIVEF